MVKNFPDKVKCPKCGSADVVKMSISEAAATEGGKNMFKVFVHCNACLKESTVTVEVINK